MSNRNILGETDPAEKLNRMNPRPVFVKWLMISSSIQLSESMVKLMLLYNVWEAKN